MANESLRERLVAYLKDMHFKGRAEAELGADSVFALFADPNPPSDGELWCVRVHAIDNSLHGNAHAAGRMALNDFGYARGLAAGESERAELRHCLKHALLREETLKLERAELQRRLDDATKKLVSARGRRNDQYAECALLRGGNPTPALPSTAKLREIAHHMCDEADLPSHYRNCFEAGRDSRASEIRDLIADEHSACERANGLASCAETAERERDAAEAKLREVGEALAWLASGASTLGPRSIRVDGGNLHRHNGTPDGILSALLEAARAAKGER